MLKKPLSVKFLSGRQDVSPAEYKRTNMQNLMYNNCSLIRHAKSQVKIRHPKFYTPNTILLFKFFSTHSNNFDVNDLMPEIGGQLS